MAKKTAGDLESWLHIGKLWAGSTGSGGWVLCFNYGSAVLDGSSINKPPIQMFQHESYS